jgi:D-alanyl-D-alanine carboxypeptidase
MRKMKSLARFGAIASLLIFAIRPAAATPSLVIDVTSGAVISQDQPTASWYPASLTKLMTAYVALDAVRSGRITMDTPLMMSPRACRMAPSKMGFRAGSEVTLKNALVMLMVKSANDIAVAIAEGVGGSVEGFAEEMNRASQKLGMTQSVWVNPNGLPDARQVTSARDLAILGRALFLEFPEHANLFNIGAMQIAGHVHATHNGLLGRYPGADGMKTGFTCPAGFNVVASASQNGRRLIAVVLGAPSAVSRTAKAAALLDNGFHATSYSGSLASLAASGPTAAPDMRDSVCRNRGAALAEFMNEVDNVAIPIGSAPSTGIPLLDAAAGQQAMSAHDVARLPRPHYDPVLVYAGRAPGYTGPVARARAPGAAIGEQPDLQAYANPEPAAGESPIGRAAPDAVNMRKAKRGKKLAPVPMPEPADSITQDDQASSAGDEPKPAAKGKAGPKTVAAPAKPGGKPSAKAATATAPAKLAAKTPAAAPATAKTVSAPPAAKAAAKPAKPVASAKPQAVAQ